MPARPWVQHYAPGVRNQLEYPEMPIWHILAQAARKWPNLPLVRFYVYRFTFQDIWQQALRMARALVDRGVRPGDRVAVMLPNCPQYVTTFFGILRAGAVVVQVNPLYTERELQYLVTNSGAQVIVVADALYEKVQASLDSTPLREVLVASLKGGVVLGPEARSLESVLLSTPPDPPEVYQDPHDVAVLQYTGGTTGVSKGAMLTHYNILSNQVALFEWQQPLEPRPGQERILNILPLFHSYGMAICMLSAVYSGSEIIMLPKFEIDEVMETIRDTRPTSFPGVPTIYTAVNQYPNAHEYGLHTIKVCNSGAAPLPLEVLQDFERKTGAQIIEGYGMSECSPVTHVNPLGGMRKPGSVGIPFPDTDVEIVDVETGTQVLAPGEVGELRVRGPQVMKGYWGMPEETARTLRDGWLYTGDIGKMDADGYFYIVDRKKDMIIVSGFNVYPRDVEEVLYEHPAVAEACVAGVPDRYQGERVKAYIVLKEGETLTEADVIAYCRERLAPFKCPRAVEFRFELPKTPVGKILRRELVAEERAKLMAART